MRVVLTRTGVVLSESGGALEKMLPPFKLGVGGPVAGGRQYVPWVHVDDVVGAHAVRASTPRRPAGPVNVTAPEPVTNRELSQRARPGTPPAGAGAGSGAGGEAPLRRDVHRSSPAASARCPRSSRSWATSSAARTSRTRCATRPGAGRPAQPPARPRQAGRPSAAHVRSLPRPAAHLAPGVAPAPVVHADAKRMPDHALAPPCPRTSLVTAVHESRLTRAPGRSPGNGSQVA